MKTFADHANSGGEQLGLITCSANTTMTHQPTLVLILGGPAAGKTRFRRERYSAGYVTIDAGEIFLLFPESKDCAEFPGPLEEELNMVGHDIAKKAIERRYDIVTEMIGEVPDDIAAVSVAMRKAGYRIQAECLTCDIAVALERNLQRGPDNISAYFTQHFHQKWLIAAANEFSRTQ